MRNVYFILTFLTLDLAMCVEEGVSGVVGWGLLDNVIGHNAKLSAIHRCFILKLGMYTTETGKIPPIGMDSSLQERMIDACNREIELRFDSRYTDYGFHMSKCANEMYIEYAKKNGFDPRDNYDYSLNQGFEDNCTKIYDKSHTDEDGNNRYSPDTKLHFIKSCMKEKNNTNKLEKEKLQEYCAVEYDKVLEHAIQVVIIHVLNFLRGRTQITNVLEHYLTDEYDFLNKK